VIHLAGVFKERLLVEESGESFAETLRAKVLGTWALHQLVKDRLQSLFITSSSVISFFGGTMAGAYAAANSFQDSFSYYQRSRRSLRSHSFSWTVWDEVGVSRGYQMKDLARAGGYQTVTAGQGLNSMLAGLHHDQAHLLVGLDGSNQHVRRYTETSSLRAQKLTAYYTARPGQSPLGRLPQLAVRDRFGAPSVCDFAPLAEMPLTEMGAIDRQRLATDGFGTRRTTTEQVSPQTELERRVAGIWKEVLGVPALGIHDNFLELGGDSLRATQIVSRLREAFWVELPLPTFLTECPTIAKTAEAIEEMLIEKLEGLTDSEAERLAASRFATLQRGPV
jgi:acyl carrier protein